MKIGELATEIVIELNKRDMKCEISSVTDNGNMIIRFVNADVPSILVANHYLNEPVVYKFNICKSQKFLMKEKRNDQWIYYYPFKNAETLINEIMMYKVIK